jgi:hypothetical protein
VCALAAALPGVEVGTSYGTPALQAGGKAFARLREHGNTLVRKVPFEVRDHLIATSPTTCFMTDHYRGYPAALVRLDAADARGLASRLEEAWRQVAPRRLVREHGARSGRVPWDRPPA